MEATIFFLLFEPVLFPDRAAWFPLSAGQYQFSLFKAFFNSYVSFPLLKFFSVILFRNPRDSKVFFSLFPLDE